MLEPLKNKLKRVYVVPFTNHFSDAFFRTHSIQVQILNAYLKVGFLLGSAGEDIVVDCVGCRRESGRNLFHSPGCGVNRWPQICLCVGGLVGGVAAGGGKWEEDKSENIMSSNLS